MRFPADTAVDWAANKSNHVLFLPKGALHIGLGRDNIHLQAGQCIFLARNTSPEIRTVRASEIVLLDFTNRISLGGHDCLTQIVAGLDSADSRCLPVLDMSEGVAALLGELRPIGSPCYHMLKEYELYMLLTNDYTRDELARFFAPMLHATDDFRTFVINNYVEGDTLDDIAQKANLSKNYFAQRFKQHFGMTPHHWLVKQKVRKLLQMVASGCSDTKVIVEKLGFKNQVGLYLFCRRNLDCTFTELTRKITSDIAKKTACEAGGGF